MYITNPRHIAQPEPVFLRLAFLTFYPPLKINQPGWKAAALFFVFFFIHPPEAEYFYNGPATAADTRHNKGNRHLAEFPQEGPVDQYIIIICLYILEEGGKRVGGMWTLTFAGGEVYGDRVQDVCGGDRRGSEKLNWWEIVSEGRLWKQPLR